MPEASTKNVAMSQVSVPVPPTPTATGWTVPKEALPQEGSASPGVRAGPSQALVWVGSEPLAWGGARIQWAERQNPKSMFFVLNDREAKDWGPYRLGLDLRSAL